MTPRDQNKFISYINNYINKDQFNKLYNSNWIKKVIQNVDAITYKLRPALIKVTNQKLNIVKKEI